MPYFMTFAQMQTDGLSDGLPSMTWVFIGVGVVLAMMVLVSFIAWIAKRYKRCPSNRVLVIFGKAGGGAPAKCIHGGAAFIWPLIQDYAFLTLEPIQIEVPLRGALSFENIRVNVPSVFTVATGTTPDLMQNAAIRLLGLSIADVKKQAEDIIFGQLRQVIASMKIEDINRDRDVFLASIQSSLEPELKKIGLVLINVNITDITDESGYIEAIGQKAASQAVQQARADVADEEKKGEIRVAEAERDKQISVADAGKDREIGTRDAEREQNVRVAQLDRDQQVGEQTASLDREVQVKAAERDMRVSVADANAKAVAGEYGSQAEIAASQADLEVKKADAYQLGETRTRVAEAAVLEVQNRAMAKAAIANAERVEAEQRAKLEAPAKAEKARVVVDAEAEANRRRIEAQGEASAIFAKLEAEAKGQYEILAKKGDGLQRIIDACGGAPQAFQLMMLEHLDNLAAASAKAISNIKFDKIVVWEGGNHADRSGTANFLHNMARTMPPMMQVLRDIGGVEFADSLVKFDADNVATSSAPRTAATSESTAAAAAGDGSGGGPPSSSDSSDSSSGKPL